MQLRNLQSSNTNTNSPGVRSLCHFSSRHELAGQTDPPGTGFGFWLCQLTRQSGTLAAADAGLPSRRRRLSAQGMVHCLVCDGETNKNVNGPR
jgi:hypothetical protein